MTLVAFSARIVQKEATELLDLQPCWDVRVSVHLNDELGNSRHNLTRILFSTKVHSLILKFRELLIKLLQSHVVKLSNNLIIIGSIMTLWETYLSWTFDKEQVCVFVPVERIDSEPFGALDKSEWPFGVKGTVKTWAAWSCRYFDNEWILIGIGFRGEVVIIISLCVSDIEIASIIGMCEKINGEGESINPIPIIGTASQYCEHQNDNYGAFHGVYFAT